MSAAVTLIKLSAVLTSGAACPSTVVLPVSEYAYGARCDIQETVMEISFF